MSRQVLGKRPRCNSRLSSPSPSRPPTPAYKTRRITREILSPDPTPNPKRVKATTTEAEYDDGSNKENIPPTPLFGPLSTSTSLDSTSDAFAPQSTFSSRALRASRRAATQPSHQTLTPHRRSSARPHTNASSSVSDAPVSGQTGQLHTPSNTPSRAISRLSLTTPPPTPALNSPSLSIVDTAKKTTSSYTEACALLRPQGHESEALIGREQERARILDFLAPFMADQRLSDKVFSLYVSGAPGTGKTALVNQILSSVSFVDDMNTSHASVRVININCMALGAKDGFTGVWERCADELDLPKETRRGSPTKIDWGHRFGKLFQGRKCILVLDEIDHLAASTSIPALASQIFAMAATPQMRDCLRVIGISNTHTLTHAKSSPHTRTLHFEPYTAAQMKAILNARIATLPGNHTLFSPASLALLCMKIASETGDIRTVFSVARRSLAMAMAGKPPCSIITVMPAHILAALKASHASISPSKEKSGAETVTRVRNLGLHARFALAALILATKRITSSLSLLGSSSRSSGSKFKEKAGHASSSLVPYIDAALPTIDITALHGFYATVLRRGADAAFSGVGRTEFADLVNLLEGSGLVELVQGRGFGSKTKRGGKKQSEQVVSIASGVRTEELIRGLIGSSDNGNTEDVAVDVREEEVKHVWEKEIARIDREIKAIYGDSSVKKADFEGAEED